MKSITFFTVLLFLYEISFSQIKIVDSLYFGQTPPGDSAIVFAPGVVSLNNRRETKIVFSKDSCERLLGVGETGSLKILHSNHYSGYWSQFVSAPFITNYFPIEPFFSPDGLKIFFTSEADIYVCSRQGQSWSTPIKLSSPVSTIAEEYHPTVSLNGTLYFCSKRENSNIFIYRSVNQNGNYNSVEKLDAVINSVTNGSNGAYDPYIARDESFIIFSSVRPGGSGNDDQYISYFKNGRWTNPKNLGSKINTNKIEYGSYVSPDNLYYFFSRPDGWGPNIPADIFWVSAGFIEVLKHTNFVPYLRNQIPNQTDSVGHLFNYTLPDTTFIDDDGNNTLTYSATLRNGSPLPSWLNFNPSSRTFSGNPTTASTDSIKVIVTDTANASTLCIFVLKIVDPNSVRPTNERIINEYKLFQNYPNPFNPVTNIKFSIPKSENVSIKVFDILGKEVENIFNGKLNAGTYYAEFNVKNISSGIFFYVLKTNSFYEKKKMVVLK